MSAALKSNPFSKNLVVKGKLLKVTCREVVNKNDAEQPWKFYSGMALVKSIKDVEKWAVKNNYDEATYKPFWSSESEFQGQKQTSHWIKFDIKSRDEIDALEHLAEDKQWLELTLAPRVREYTGKDGETKTELSLSLFPGKWVETTEPVAEVEKPAKKQKRTA